MESFTSFVITETDEFFGPTEDFEDIITHHNLDINKVVCVKISPPKDNPKCSDFSQWIFKTYNIDCPQLEFRGAYGPRWTFLGDPLPEKRTREALLRRSISENWFLKKEGQNLVGGFGSVLTGGNESCLQGGILSTLVGGSHSTLRGGCFSTIIGDNYSCLFGEDDSILTSRAHSIFNAGDYCTITCGGYSTIITGNCAQVISGPKSTVISGDNSRVYSGNNSVLTSGEYSILVSGDGSILTGGEKSVLEFRTWDNNRFRITIGYVGENGLKNNTKYCCKNGIISPA